MLNKTELHTTTDAQLVLRYQEGRDERAFAEMVRRHGPMVRAVARRLLDRSVDVDDAVQSTFFAFAMRTDHFSDRVALAGWLHRAAYSCSADILRARRRHDRRVERFAARLKTNPNAGEPDPVDTVANEELKRIIDQELARLPLDIQAAVVLCDLEGLTHKQAGVRLGIASSTVSDRVANGRNRLHKQLLRRGVTLSVTLLAGLATATNESSAALATSSIAELTTNATLVAAGHPVSNSSAATAVQIANRVITTMKTTKFISLAVTALLLIATAGSLPSIFSTANQLFAGVMFTEDFEGSFDGSWEVVHGRARLERENGRLVVYPTGELGEAILIRPLDAKGTPIVFDDVSIHASTEGAVAQMGIFTRMDFQSSSWLPAGQSSVNNGMPPGYYGTIDGANAAAIFNVFNRRISEVGTAAFVDFPILNRPTDIQLDSFGTSISLFVTEPKNLANEFKLSSTDTANASGEVGLWIIPRPGGVPASQQIAVFDNITVVPEPNNQFAALGLATLVLLSWRRCPGH